MQKWFPLHWNSTAIKRQAKQYKTVQNRLKRIPKYSNEISDVDENKWTWNFRHNNTDHLFSIPKYPSHSNSSVYTGIRRDRRDPWVEPLISSVRYKRPETCLVAVLVSKRFIWSLRWFSLSTRPVALPCPALLDTFSATHCSDWSFSQRLSISVFHAFNTSSNTLTFSASRQSPAPEQWLLGNNNLPVGLTAPTTKLPESNPKKLSTVRDWRSTPTYCQLESHVTQKL